MTNGPRFHTKAACLSLINLSMLCFHSLAVVVQVLVFTQLKKRETQYGINMVYGSFIIFFIQLKADSMFVQQLITSL